MELDSHKTDNNSQKVASNKSETLQPFGQTLKNAREKKGVSLDDAAKELFILRRYLQALEAEDFEALPQVTFARGFAVNYAKYLGLDSTQMANSFDACYPDHMRPKTAEDIHSPMRPMGTLERDGQGGLKFNIWLIAGVVIAVVAGILIFKTVNKAKSDSQDTESATQIEVSPQDQVAGASLASTGVAIPPPAQANPAPPTPPTETTPAVSPIVANTNAGSTSMAPVATPAVETPAPPVANPSQTQPQTNQKPAKLELWIRDNTNVNITDATGKVVLQGEKTRGGYTVEGLPPFNINIDKVNNVSLDLNKQPIKLSQYAQNNQANFTLNP